MNDLETRILDYLASRHPLEQPLTAHDIYRHFPNDLALDFSEAIELLWKSGRVNKMWAFGGLGGRLVPTYEAIRPPTPPVGETLEQA